MLSLVSSLLLKYCGSRSTSGPVHNPHISAIHLRAMADRQWQLRTQC